MPDINAKLIINRGTTYKATFKYTKNGEPETLVGATVYFTVKKEEWDDSGDDTSAAIKKTVTSHSDATNGETLIHLTPTDTYIEPGEYIYDIRVEEDGGDAYKVVEGPLELDGSPTNRNV